MMNSYICMCDPNYPYQYNMGSLHWCFHCSYSMPLYPSAVDAQVNTLSESMMVLQETMKELQANNKRMLSSICHVRSLLQEEMQLESTETLEISDSTIITSVLEPNYNDSNTEVADFMESRLDSQLQLSVLGVGYTIPKHIFPSVLFSTSIDTTELEFSPLSFLVKGLTLPVKGYRHMLDMVYDCKVFDILPKREIFAEFLVRHTTIDSLPHALGLHIYNWFDTGQVLGACFDKVNSGVYLVNRVLFFGCSNDFPLLSVDDASDVYEVSLLTTTHKVFVDMSDRITLLQPYIDVALKAPTIEDIDKTIVAISEQMEIIKMLQETISSHICAAADFFESELPAANNKKEGSNNALEIMLVGYCPKIAPDVFYEMLRKAGGAFKGLKMWSCSQHTIKCSLDASEIGNRYVVLVTSLEELSHNECMLLGFGFVLGAERILFKLVEKVAAPCSVFLDYRDLTDVNATNSQCFRGVRSNNF